MHVGTGADQHPAAEGRTVAHGDEHPVVHHDLAIQLRPVRDRPEGAQHGQHRPDVQGGAAGPGHLVGPLVRARVEPRGHHAQEVPDGPVGSLDATDVERPARAGQDHRDRRLRAGLGQADGVRGIVAGPERDDPEGGVRADHRLQRLVHGAVPTDRHEDVQALGHRVGQQLLGLLGGLALDGHDVVTAAGQPAQDGGAVPTHPARPGRGIDQYSDTSLHGVHATAGQALSQASSGDVSSSSHSGSAPRRRDRRRSLSQQTTAGQEHQHEHRHGQQRQVERVTGGGGDGREHHDPQHDPPPPRPQALRGEHPGEVEAAPRAAAA